MLMTAENFIPVITSEAGLCLTAQEWQEAKVTTVSYSLEFLLHKPGKEILNKIQNLSNYVGWSGQLVLNAMSLTANKEGNYWLRSPYDGSKLMLTGDELIELILRLRPDAILLPKKIILDYPAIWENWIDTIIPFVHADDIQDDALVKPFSGVYFNDPKDKRLEQWRHLSRYVTGATAVSEIQALRANGIDFIETNEPANSALHGKVYCRSGLVDLKNKDMELQFSVIDESCGCPVCSQKLTKAYFHHLLQHTPLLCQRFLIQHNTFWMANL